MLVQTYVNVLKWWIPSWYFCITTFIQNNWNGKHTEFFRRAQTIHLILLNDHNLTDWLVKKFLQSSQERDFCNYQKRCLGSLSTKGLIDCLLGEKFSFSYFWIPQSFHCQSILGPLGLVLSFYPQQFVSVLLE